MSDNGKILVVGAGSAGSAAAIAAARSGANVVLVEKTDCVGGIVAQALIHTLGGLFDAQGASLNPGLPAELIERLRQTNATKLRIGRLWTFAVAPEKFQAVVEKWLAEEPRIRLCLKAQINNIQHTGRRWRAKIAVAGRMESIEADALIDTTGDASLLRQIAPACVEDDTERAAGGLIFVLSDVAPDALRFPKNADVRLRLRRAAESGELPLAAASAWLDQGSAPREAYVKLFVPLPKKYSPALFPQRGASEKSSSPPARDKDDWVQAERAALTIRDALWAFLRRQEAFRDAKIIRTGTLGLRDGGRIRGAYRLTEKDVREGKKFPDAVCYGAWPIEYWDAERGAMLLPVGGDGTYDIPASALRVKNLPHVWAAGKCLSADRIAQASFRVVGTCWATGAAAGTRIRS